MKKLIVGLILALPLVDSTVLAAPLTEEETKAVDQEVRQRILIEPTKLDAPALAKVFEATFYRVKVAFPDGEYSNLQLARVGDKFVDLAQLDTGKSLAKLMSLVKPDFTFASEADAKMFEQALDEVYPVLSDFGKKSPKQIEHDGATWTFVRGNFFKKLKGFVVTTDEGGRVKDIRYSLSIEQAPSSPVPMTAEQTNAVKQEVMRQISTTPTKLDAPALAKVFEATFYRVKIALANGVASNWQLTRVGDKFVDVDQPTTNESLSKLTSIVKREFTLASESNAKVFQQALDEIYPDGGNGAAKMIRHEGATWTFVNGTFFQKLKGFVVTTEKGGRVKYIRYSLQIER